MKRLSEEIVSFFHKQPYTIFTTIGKDGYPYSACKGIVNIEKKGQICLLDLYKGKTYENLKRNPHISITAVDEHKFVGYCLKGKAKVVKREMLKFRMHIMEVWEKRVLKRISNRVLKNLRGEIGHPRHPEALLPKPEYRIVVEVKEIVDLTPHQVKETSPTA